MFGAQARAAEYNAARNASARQASREAEEQKLPPKSAPISLSAFTKNVQGNRNKGNKSWVPLVLEDEGEVKELIMETSNNQTPTTSPRTNSDPPFENSGASPSQIRVRIPKCRPPSAPRAMRPVQSQQLNLAGSGPTRSQSLGIVFGSPHPIQQFNLTGYVPDCSQPFGVMFRSPHHVPETLFGPQNSQVPGVYPYPEYVWIPDLPVPHDTGDVYRSSPQGMQRFGGMIAPTEVTPTKQEQKLSNLSQIYPNPSTCLYQERQVFQEVDNDLKADLPRQPYFDLPTLPLHIGAESRREHRESPYSSLHQPFAPQFYADGSTLSSSAMFSPTAPRRIVGQQLMIGAATASYPRLSNRLSHLAANDRSSIQVDENDEPYDRKAKMQKFVAAQQALARTGKTVLHNPSLHKYLQEKRDVWDGARTTHSDLANPLASVTNSPRFDNERIVPATHDRIAAVENRRKILSRPQNCLSKEDIALHHEFQVGTMSWFDPTAPTRTERQKMSDIMSMVALKMMNETLRSDGKQVECSRESENGRWLRTDPRSHQAARAIVDELAAAYVERKREESIISQEENDVQKRGADVCGGAIRAAGNVLANLTEYILEGSSANSHQDYFNRTRTAPEFAIQNDNFQGTGCGSTSYFDDFDEVPANVPSRISTDQRFLSERRG